MAFSADASLEFARPNGIEDYIHRIGRTGRAGAKGTAYAYVTAENSRKCRYWRSTNLKSSRKADNVHYRSQALLVTS